MQTNGQCRVCECNIRPGVTICETCRDERNYYAAKVSVNKKRLQQTLTERKITKEWLDKVSTQSTNILETFYNYPTFTHYPN